MIRVENIDQGRGYITGCEVSTDDLDGNIGISLLSQLVVAILHVYRTTEGKLRRRDGKEMTIENFVTTLGEIALKEEHEAYIDKEKMS